MVMQKLSKVGSYVIAGIALVVIIGLMHGTKVAMII